MDCRETSKFLRRIYPLAPQDMTEEELAVIFAMTSRRPEGFSQIRDLVTAEKAADFHERWVLGYGHASVAEHAVIHMAVENISRLACDTLEDNRLASYTEKSSRFQVLDKDSFYVPGEFQSFPKLLKLYVQGCQRLFELYEKLLDKVLEYLRNTTPKGENERTGAYNLRLRRKAIDSCRFVLPAATLTNVGVSMNARSMEHAIQKLLSTTLEEEKEIGQIIKEQGQTITPTLIRYAEPNQYLGSASKGIHDIASSQLNQLVSNRNCSKIHTRLLFYDDEAQIRLITSLLFAHSLLPYSETFEAVNMMAPDIQKSIFEAALKDLGPHDAPIRELEMVDYLFEFYLDYGAYREFKRHRMQSYIAQPLTVDLGFICPPLIEEAGQQALFLEAMKVSSSVFDHIRSFKVPDRLAEYVVTHAHCRRVLSKMNLRECYHFFKMRTQLQAHFTIQEAATQALKLVEQVHPLLIKYVQVRRQ